MKKLKVASVVGTRPEIIRLSRVPARLDVSILAKQQRVEDRMLREVADYSMPNVSDKVVRIIHSYTDYVNRNVLKKWTNEQ